MTLEQVDRKFQTVWEDFIVQNTSLYNTQLLLSDLTASDDCKLTALNFSRYHGYVGTGYGESSTSVGVTEQQAYDLWDSEFNRYQKIAKKQLLSKNIVQMSQTMFDALVLFNWATGNLFYSNATEGQYNMTNAIVTKDIDTIANMMSRSVMNKEKCMRCASVLRLADYGNNKNRSWMRTNGIYYMRDQNEKNLLTDAQLKRARFAYYAETLKFLPFTPESIKRDIAKRYNQTLVNQTFTYSGSNTFTMDTNFSMDPIEKLEVRLNGEILDHLFDFTVSDLVVTITKSMTNGDIIRTQIKI